MRLYLCPSLLDELSKSQRDNPEEKPKQKADANKPVDVSGGRGEQRGGKYVARVQDGYEKDGSPKYKYFHSEEEYQTFLEGKGKSKEGKKLESKVKREHAESTDQHTGLVVHQPASKKPGNLLSKEKAAKSLRLYVKV